MPIRTERLTLRLFTTQDFQALRELDGDPAVLRHRSRNVISPDITREFLEEAQKAHHETPRAFFAYAIIRQRDGRWLGQCGMTMIPDSDLNDKHAFMWYSLLPRFWGAGYMTEAVQALIQVGFDHFGLKNIEAECTPENIASARVLEKAGLPYQGEVERETKDGSLIKRRHFEMDDQTFNQMTWPTLEIEEPC